VSEQLINGTSAQCRLFRATPLTAGEKIYGNVVSLDIAQYKLITWPMMYVDNSTLLPACWI